MNKIYYYFNRFEEGMRAERERRTEKSWSFCWYFLLQEELAHVFQLLALYDEALVQYDELDALFTQFVVNSAAGGEWYVTSSIALVPARYVDDITILCSYW